MSNFRLLGRNVWLHIWIWSSRELLSPYINVGVTATEVIFKAKKLIRSLKDRAKDSKNWALLYCDLRGQGDEEEWTKA